MKDKYRRVLRFLEANDQDSYLIRKKFAAASDAEKDTGWRTTKTGKHYHINEEGEVDKGSPTMKGKKLGKSAPTGKGKKSTPKQSAPQQSEQAKSAQKSGAKSKTNAKPQKLKSANPVTKVKSGKKNGMGLGGIVKGVIGGVAGGAAASISSINKVGVHAGPGGTVSGGGGGSGQGASTSGASNVNTNIAKEMYEHTTGKYTGKGNIDLNSRPVVRNSDGSISTEKSFSTNIDGKEVLLPTVINGKIVDEDTAIEHYMKTGEYLGMFDTVKEANEYGDLLHKRQDWYYNEFLKSKGTKKGGSK